MKLKTLIRIFILLIAITGCTATEQQSQLYNQLNKTESNDIVNGQTVGYSSLLASTIVYISYEDDNGLNNSCTGTFISSKYILTAGHCISKSGPEGMSVYFRRVDYNKTGNVDNIQIISAYQIKLDNYKSERENLALIEFSGGLPKNARRAVITEGLSSPKNLNQIPFLAVGYGRNTGVQKNDELSNGGAGVLRFRKMVAQNIIPTQDTFIVDQRLGGACFGDSGGPALRINKQTGQLEVIGVASGIKPSKDKNIDECLNSSIYLNLFFYSETLKKIIQ